LVTPFFADKVLAAAEWKTLALGDHHDDGVDHESRPDIVEVARPLVVEIDPEDDVDLTLARRFLRVLPGAGISGLDGDLEFAGDALHQSGADADDALAVLIADRRILGMAGDRQAAAGGRLRESRTGGSMP